MSCNKHLTKLHEVSSSPEMHASTTLGNMQWQIELSTQ